MKYHTCIKELLLESIFRPSTINRFVRGISTCSANYKDNLIR